MKGVIIRKAVISDINTIKHYIEKFNLDITNISHSQFTIAEIGKNIIGFGRIKPYKQLLELASIGIINDYRGNGIGKILVKNIINQSPSNELWLTTKIPEYFEKFGFRICHIPPKAIKYKQKNLCSKLQGNLNKTFCMILKKNSSNELTVNVSKPIVKFQMIPHYYV